MLSQLTPVCPQPLLNQAQALPAMATAVVNAGSELALESAKLAFEASISMLIACDIHVFCFGSGITLWVFVSDK